MCQMTCGVACVQTDAAVWNGTRAAEFGLVVHGGSKLSGGLYSGAATARWTDEGHAARLRTYTDSVSAWNSSGRAEFAALLQSSNVSLSATWAASSDKEASCDAKRCFSSDRYRALCAKTCGVLCAKGWSPCADNDPKQQCRFVLASCPNAKGRPPPPPPPPPPTKLGVANEKTSFTTSGWSNTAYRNEDGKAHGPFGRRQSVSKTYSGLPSHKSLSLSVRFWSIDSWDSEWGYIYVDGAEVWKKQGWADTCRSWSQYNGNFYNPWSGNNGAHKCYSDVHISNRAHTKSSVNLRFHSNIGSGASDESFFFNRLILAVCLSTTCTAGSGVGFVCKPVAQLLADVKTRAGGKSYFMQASVGTNGKLSLEVRSAFDPYAQALRVSTNSLRFGSLPPKPGTRTDPMLPTWSTREDWYVHGRMRKGSISRTYSGLRPHKALRVRLRYWAVDSWDGEEAWVSIDNQRKWTIGGISRQSCDPNGGEGNGGQFRADPAHWNNAQNMWTYSCETNLFDFGKMKSWNPFVNFFGWNWLGLNYPWGTFRREFGNMECYRDVDVMHTHSGSLTRLTVGSSINGDDEAFLFSHVQVFACSSTAKSSCSDVVSDEVNQFERDGKTGWPTGPDMDDYKPGEGTDTSRREAIAPNIYGPYTPSDCGELKSWWWFIEDGDPLARNYYWLSDPDRWTSHWFLIMLPGFSVLLLASWLAPRFLSGCKIKEDQNCFSGTPIGRHNNDLHSGSDIRVIVRGNDDDCTCVASRCRGFKIDNRNMPRAVRDRGLPQDVWDEYMSQMRAGGIASGCCSEFLRVFAAFGWSMAPNWMLSFNCSCFWIVWLPILNFYLMFATCMMMIPWSLLEPGQWRTRFWLRSFNGELEIFGMYAKIFTFKMMNNGMDRHGERSMSTLIIALSSEEAEWLKRQPVLQQGHTNDCGWGLWCCPAHDGRMF